jgi:hypothetical protein
LRVNVSCSVDAELHVQVAGRTATGADLALGLEVDPVAGRDTGGDLHVDRAAGADAALAGALAAGVRDRGAVAAARGARLGRTDVADERALHLRDLAVALARTAGDGVAAGRAGAVADVADDGRVDRQRLGHAERRLGERQPEPYERVLAPLYPRARPAGRAAAEHRVDEVREVERAAEPAHVPHAAEAGPAATTHRVAAAVVQVTLVRVAEDLVRLADLLEALGGVRF